MTVCIKKQKNVLVFDQEPQLLGIYHKEIIQKKKELFVQSYYNIIINNEKLDAARYGRLGK